MKKLILILLLFLANYQLNAQQKRDFTKYEVSGLIVEKNSNQALEFATIIFKPLRGKRVFGGLTDSKGNLLFKFSFLR